MLSVQPKHEGSERAGVEHTGVHTWEGRLEATIMNWIPQKVYT